MICTKKELDDKDKKIIELLQEGKVYKEIAWKVGESIRQVQYRIKVMRDYYDCATVPALIHKLSQDDCTKS